MQQFPHIMCPSRGNSLFSVASRCSPLLSPPPPPWFSPETDTDYRSALAERNDVLLMLCDCVFVQSETEQGSTEWPFVRGSVPRGTNWTAKARSYPRICLSTPAESWFGVRSCCCHLEKSDFSVSACAQVFTPPLNVQFSVSLALGPRQRSNVCV